MRIVVGLAVRRPGWSSWRGWPCSSWPTPAAGLAHPPPPNSSFLPTDVESQRAAALEAARFGGGHQVAELVIVDQQGLSATEEARKQVRAANGAAFVRPARLPVTSGASAVA